MAKEREFCCTIAAPSIINFENHCICQCNVNGHFPIRHWLTLQASDHISRKCEIWKYVDYHMNIQSILTSNGFLNISIHLPAAGEAAAEAVLSLQTRLCSTCTTSGWASSDISPAAACLWAVSRIIRAACSGTLYCSCSMLTQYCSAVGHGNSADPSQIDCKNQTTVI